MDLSINQNNIVKSQHDSLIINTLATGVAVFVLLNAEIAIICMVANVALSILVQHKDKITFWFRWDNKAVKHLKDYWEGSLPYFKLKLGLVIWRKLFTAPQQGQVQTVVKIFINALANPYLAVFLFLRTCVVAPIIEEIIFRGFLQEKIRNVQVFIFGAKWADHKVNKVIRVGLQAIVFGLAHVRPDQAGINGIIFIGTGISGAYNGYLKEKTGTLWCSIAEHAHWNTSSAASIIADHYLPWTHAPVPTAVPAAHIYTKCILAPPAA